MNDESVQYHVSLCKKLLVVLFCLLLTGVANAQQTLTINAPGDSLRNFYLGLNVDSLWLPGHHIDWETGEPDNPLATKGIKTHCSRFVAATCKRLGIYILSPGHGTKGSLANAQYKWLFTKKALKRGWIQITDSFFTKAQSLANAGCPVVVVYKNPDPKKSGHIALVMPANTNRDSVILNGPVLIQAGRYNGSSISFYHGFGHHIGEKGLDPSEFAFFYNWRLFGRKKFLKK